MINCFGRKKEPVSSSCIPKERARNERSGFVLPVSLALGKVALAGDSLEGVHPAQLLFLHELPYSFPERLRVDGGRRLFAFRAHHQSDLAGDRRTLPQFREHVRTSPAEKFLVDLGEFS